MTIKELARKTKATPVISLMDAAARASTGEIADVQREQLRKGENALSQPIGRYRPAYGAFKQTLSSYRAPVGVPDLFLTGAYHRSIKVAVSRGDYKVYATDEKAEKLESKYGNILGINSNSMSEVHSVTTRKLSEQVKQRWGLS